MKSKVKKVRGIKQIIISAGLFAGISVSQAALIVSYNLNGSSFAPTASDPSISASDVGTTGDWTISGSGGNLVITQLTTDKIPTGAPDLTEYIKFAINPLSTTVSVSNIHIDFGGENTMSATPYTLTVQLRSSVDGYATVLGSDTRIIPANTTVASLTPTSFDVSGVPSLQNRTSTVEFRFYVYDDNTITNKTVRARVDNISASGSVGSVYLLTVNNGTGDGSYTNGQQVAISADVIGGKTFVQWTGDTAYLADSNAASTTVTMPTQAVSVTAMYVDTTYALTVNNGSGDGSYTNGQVVAITADAPASGYAFANWSGDTAYLTDSNAASTTVTMPMQAVSVIATYIATEQYTTNGTPYSWLASYGLTNYVADDLLDQDSDGLKTWQEYIAGTNPTNALSVLKAAQATRNVVTWIPVTGRVYSVYWSTNLVKGFSNLNNNATSPFTNATPDSRVNHYQIKVRMQ